MHWDVEAGSRWFLQSHFHFLSESFRDCTVLILLEVHSLSRLMRLVLVGKLNFTDSSNPNVSIPLLLAMPRQGYILRDCNV